MQQRADTHTQRPSQEGLQRQGLPHIFGKAQGAPSQARDKPGVQNLSNLGSKGQSLRPEQVPAATSNLSGICSVGTRLALTPFPL